MSRQKIMRENPMRKIRLEKVLLSCSGSGTELEKSKKLIEYISGKKAHLIKAGPKRRIPDFGVKPHLEIGARATLRGEEARKMLQRLLAAIDNELPERNINNNFFSFGIKEYIEIPGAEYKRDLGIRGLNVTAVFIRAGFRVQRKKIKSGKLPKKQQVTQEEIKSHLQENFKIEVLGK